MKDDLTDSVEDIKEVLPFMVSLDKKWKSVRAKLFKPEEYRAHKQFYEVISSLTKSKTELNNLLMEKDYTFSDDVVTSSNHIE